MSATDVTVMMTVLGVGTFVGAVYTPVVEPMVPSGFGVVVLVGSDQVTFRQVGLEVILHPGLLTVAANRKVSPVPTVAEVGLILMLIPVTIVSLAAAVLVVSALWGGGILTAWG